MPIIATAGESGNHTPAPEGMHQAVCVDVIDLGRLPNKFRPGTTQPKINVAWQITELRDDGKRYVLYKRYTLSLNEKATLRHDLESWRGKKFTAEELSGFDVEKVKGINCLINVQHSDPSPEGKVFANVITVSPLLKGMPPIAADGYVRQATDANSDTQPEPPPHTDDDLEPIPFAWLLPLMLPIIGAGVMFA